MEEITKIGLEVFGNIEKLELWLHTPNNALGGFKPFELLNDVNGKDLIVRELNFISYGILA